MGKALRSLSCSSGVGIRHMLTTPVTVQSKQSYATAKKTATGAKRLQHWLNPLLRHQLRVWSKSQKPMNIFPQMSVVFKQFLLLISSVTLGGSSWGDCKTDSSARRQSSDFTTVCLERCQPPKHACKVINILYSQQ